MSVLLYAEHSNGSVKKAVLQAATVGKALADQLGTDLVAVAFGPGAGSTAGDLGNYGVSKVLTAEGVAAFNDQAYTAGIAAAAQQVGANAVVMAQTYNGKSVAPRLSVRLDAALLSGITSVPEAGNGFRATRLTNSGKGVETIRSNKGSVVITVRGNSVKESASGGSASVEALSGSFEAKGAVSKGIEKSSGGISITEADIVVSGGRGIKGPENWSVLLDLAEALHAGTACSKPVADMDWRPHHEHVGQTGIQIGPNLYIAMGISGAIQHLAGVNSSKNIVVINKDPEAPFFKIADYGIVGDLFEVVPKMTARVKELKG